MTQPDAAPILEVRDLRVSYGAIEALKGVSLTLSAREIVTLIGANGAGKSTTLRAIMGLVPAAAGEVRFRGQLTGRTATYELVRDGLTLVPEGRAIFANLTVRENLEMGAYSRHDKREIEADFERVYRIFPRMKEREGQIGGTLSGGEQQMLAISRALMSRPKLLLLDEPSMGLAPLMVEKIFDVVRAIAAEGVTLLLVEQNARLALEVSRRGYVLEGGVVTIAGEASALLGDPRIREAYLGE
jgi:branched-chain amino acid transport system ATP-binding protein